MENLSLCVYYIYTVLENACVGMFDIFENMYL
jgi:hypothetical protein